MEAAEFFISEVIEKLNKDLADSKGNEIFMVGFLDNNTGRVNDYKILARGNKNMAPAIINDLKPGNIIIHNHPSGELTPSAADIRIASRMGEKGVGFAIINNQIDEVYIVVEPLIPEEERALDEEEIIALFKPGGGLSRKLIDFEYREQQLDVVRAVIESFNNHQEYFIEAGTGTGKSFAYLVPALYWAHLNKCKVLISTNTINLQEQLINKDLVLLKKVLPFSFKEVLVKGRSNYLCKRKLRNLEKRAREVYTDQPDKEIELIRILNWVEETENGSRSDLNFVLQTDLWEELASESDLCMGTKCLFFKSCFFMQARKNVYNADLLVVNHHLLVADAVLKKEAGNADSGILPKYSNVIIDEAHNFADTATKHLGRPFYGNLTRKYIQRLFSSRFSFLPRLRDKISGFKNESKIILFNIIDDKLIPQIKKLSDLKGNYFNYFNKLFSDNTTELRITSEMKASPEWENLQQYGESISSHLKKLHLYLSELYKKTVNLSTELSVDEELIVELESFIYRFKLLYTNLDFNLQAEDSDYVFWLEKSGKETINQKNAPLEIDNILHDLLWDRLDSLVLTSATMTVDHSFMFFKELLGLSKSNDLLIDSPFNYREQAKLIIPQDIPPANSNKFLEKIIEELQTILISYGGKTLVLFTSYSMLNYCEKKLRKELDGRGINLLSQLKYPRSYIIEHFKSNERQVIFGTVSFWEGIDVKGDSLQYLIIMKLPFPVPSEPVAAARMEKMEKEGINPFMNYSLPRAVIKFKQGFGRLIRSREDKGVIINFDNRLLTKSYGRFFLNSLPDCPIIKTGIKTIHERGIEG
ncbi:MAG TPA: helicase C-terminal domain-containing protein [Halanaerobiales bacterium]|nr:helicase C-terminal domain-containing protein [Halanaerobiales bacterium]